MDIKGTICMNFSPQEVAVSNNNKGVGWWGSDELNDGTCCQADVFNNVYGW